MKSTIVPVIQCFASLPAAVCAPLLVDKTLLIWFAVR